MIEISIPGYGDLKLKYMVLDFNGTMAIDGELTSGVKKRLKRLSKDVEIYVVTADTFGKAKSQLRDLPVLLTVLPTDVPQDIAKVEHVNRLGAEATVCIGNGRNDKLMLKQAALGIAVLLDEGTATETILAADILTKDIKSALELLLSPLRLVATLRA